MFKSALERTTGETIISDKEYDDLSDELEHDIQGYMSERKMDSDDPASRNQAIDWANRELEGTNVQLEREKEDFSNPYRSFLD